MKYKVGDKVKIKSLDWYNANKDNSGDIRCNSCSFIDKMSCYCGYVATITGITERSYNIDVDNGKWFWSDDMFEGHFEGMKTIISGINYLLTENMKNEIVIPDGWEVEKVEGNKIILKEKKKELPKTWEECCLQLNDMEYINSCSEIVKKERRTDYSGFLHRNILPKGMSKPILALCQLLVCREVYRQGWKPDWTDPRNIKSIIEIDRGKACKSHVVYGGHFLTFQDDETRDEFLENYKDLIEEAKKLI